jgi:hypothetical protein
MVYLIARAMMDRSFPKHKSGAPDSETRALRRAPALVRWLFFGVIGVVLMADRRCGRTLGGRALG